MIALSPRARIDDFSGPARHKIANRSRRTAASHPEPSNYRSTSLIRRTRPRGDVTPVSRHRIQRGRFSLPIVKASAPERAVAANVGSFNHSGNRTALRRPVAVSSAPSAKPAGCQRLMSGVITEAVGIRCSSVSGSPRFVAGRAVRRQTGRGTQWGRRLECGGRFPLGGTHRQS